MGRPSRKRPRPPPLTDVEKSASQPTHQWRSAPVLAGACSTYNSDSSLRSLVTSSSTGGGHQKETADEATLTVQHVWGALSEEDVAAASSSLSLGVNIEIDRAGVAWLVNTATPREQRQQCVERSSSVAALDSQQPISDGHSPSAVQEPSTPATGAAHDHAKTAVSPSSAPFCACEASLCEQLSRAKEEFDDVPVAVFKRVRSACNPAEALGSGCFLNRSAMKLANIDAVVEGLLVQAPGRSRREDGENTGPSARGKGEASQPHQFVDLCGGPGGFSEYLLRRRRQLGLPSRGWGVSLREDEGARVGLGVIDSTGDEHCGGATSQDAAVMDGQHTGARDGDYARHSLVLGGKENRTTTISQGDTGSNMGETVPMAVSAAGPLQGSVAAHHGGRGHDGRDAERDPCAWRLDHLRPWCDVSFATAGTEAAPTATKFCSGKGDAAKHAVGEAVDSVDNGTAAAPAPMFEMRIDYGPKGTGDLTDVANMQGFVDAVLASTAGRRRPDLVVADGGFGAARDALAQESLVSPLVHSEALAALLLLRDGGVFVCKLFECWTESTAALVYLLHRKFRRIAIVKPITSRPASGERYLVCAGLLPPPPSPPGCRYTTALRAKVLALQETRRRRRNGGASPPHATVLSDSWVEEASCSVAQEGRGGGEGDGEVHGDGLRVGAASIDGGDDAVVAAAGGRLDAALGVEAEMKQDESFVSYLRLSNNTLASLQAKACARIVDVASTKRGRAWAFRDSKSSRGVGRSGSSGCSKNAVAVRGRLPGSAEGTEESGDNAAAVRRFSRAWGLDGI